MAAIAFGVGIYFAIQLYHNYDPNAWIYAENKPIIGSWLILPAIGLTISPIILLRDIITAEHFFNQNTWQGLLSSGFAQSADVMLLLGAEIIYNFLFLAFSLLVIITFYTRRTSAPKLISIYYLLSFLIPLIDYFLVEVLLPGQLSEVEKNATYKEVARGVIAAAIWIPYFNISSSLRSCLS